jgi:pyruvate dehydrogenase E2 component (dihydrolipoamide acetyltransferase)
LACAEDFVTDFILPELGENVSSGDVLRVLVKAGDTVAKDQLVLELETDKATIEVPSSVAGTVSTVKVKPGDKVKVGQAILSVDESQQGSSAQAGASAASAPAQPAPPKAEPKPSPAPAASQAAPAPSQTAQTPNSPAAERRPAAQKVVDISRAARPTAPAAPAAAAAEPSAPAAPSVRRLARELGVDVNQVSGSGPAGRISLDDVKEFAKRVIAAASAAPAADALAIVREPLPDFSKWGEVERQALRAVRRKTALHLTAAWQTIPHVTQHDAADITNLESIRKNYSKLAEAAGGPLTVTAVAVKIVATALKVFPQFNASIDLANDELILKKYVHIGVAVDTERGLLVPVIRDADKKNMIQIAVELTQLSERARSRKISLDEMQGGCFSISNLGGIGGTLFTPIVNAPEVAILGISRGKYEPVYTKATGQFEPRFMLPLSLSYDHRVIDGADGIRFLRWVVEAFEQPFVMTLQG